MSTIINPPATSYSVTTDLYLDVSDYGGLSSALTDVSLSGKNLCISDAQTLTANATLSGRLLKILKGGSIVKDSTYTFTVTDGQFEAGDFQVFLGFSAGDITGLFEARPEWWGYKTDNLTASADANTAALQAAVRSGRAAATHGLIVVIPPGAAYVNPTYQTYNDGTYTSSTPVAVAIPSRVQVSMYGAELMSTAQSAGTYSILASYLTTGVRIRGGSVTGDLATHTGASGEFGYNIDIRGASDVVVEDITSTAAWGDGVFFGYINSGGIQNNTNVQGKHITSRGNRRQGMSITSMVGGEFVNCTFADTNGTNPQAGVDIEVDLAAGTASDITFTTCIASGNTGWGFYVNGSHSTNLTERIHFIGCIAKENTAGGFIIRDANDSSVIGGSAYNNAGPAAYIYESIAGKSHDNIISGLLSDSNNDAGSSFGGILVHDGKHFILANNIVRKSGFAGIRLEGTATNIDITGGIIDASSQDADNTHPNLLITDTVSYVTVRGVQMRQGAETNDPKYGIYLDNTVDNIIVENNDLADSGQTGPIRAGGTNLTIKHNTGYVTEAEGVTSAIATGATVTHGLSGTPDVVLLTAGDTGVSNVYPSALGASTFAINYAGGGTHVFYWKATYIP